MTNFYESWNQLEVNHQSDALTVGDNTVMWQWEAPLMEKYAKLLSGPQQEVLEIGYGMGVFANYLQSFGVKTHTILEPHPAIYEKATAFKNHHQNIKIINDFWQNQINNLDKYHAIFFDSWSEDGNTDNDVFHFFEVASQTLLKPNGKLAFWHYNNHLNEKYQQKLLEHFDHIEIFAINDLKPNAEAKKKGFTSFTILPIAIK